MVIISDEPPIASTSLGPAGGNTAGLGAAGDVGALIRPGQASEIVPMAALNPDGTSGGIIEEAPSASENEKGKKKKKTTKRTKKVQAAQDGDDVRATIEMQINRPRRIAGQKRERRKKDGEGRRRRQRAETPEGAEDEVIDHSTMTMTDLCKDLKIGRKFSKAAEIKDRILRKKVEAAKAKMRKDHPELIPIIDGDEGESSAGPAQAGPSGTAAEPIEVPVASTSGPQLRIVDGQIVVDESTLQVDRHKNAEKDRGEMREIEENDFSRVITSGTYMKRERAQLWDHAGNDLFYKGLRMFGTDFEMIAKMFPHRNRRQIKLKFNKEEKDNPHRINKALMGVKEEIDLDEFEKIADIKLEEVSAIEAEHESYDQEERAKLDRHAAEVAETTRKKKEAIQSQNKSQREKVQAILATADDSDDEERAVRGMDSAKENTEPARGQSREASAAPKSKKKAAPRKPRKNKHSYRAGGEEVEILGTID
jgi:transcription factor TFIIIB component B''